MAQAQRSPSEFQVVRDRQCVNQVNQPPLGWGAPSAGRAWGFILAAPDLEFSKEAFLHASSDGLVASQLTISFKIIPSTNR